MLGAVLATGCQQAEDPSAAIRYLEAAIRAGRWLESESAAGNGAAIPDELSGAVASAGLGTGAAGHAVFFAELFAASEDSTFLESAIAAAEIAHRQSAAMPVRYGLYNGIAGVAFALAETAVIAEDAQLEDRAQRTFRRLVDAADQAKQGARWTEANDVLAGTAGIGLALLYAFEQFGDSTFLHTAIRAGDDLLGEAEHSPEGPTRWMRGTETALDLPNFSHGTAGVGFFMARLGAVSGLVRFTEAAHGAVAYLELIADRQQDLWLVPYGVPNEGYASPHDIGWAHGPAGTARLYYELWAQTGDSGMLNRVDASARTVVASGIPGVSRDSTLWTGPFRIDRRFGTSSAAAFLMDWGSAARSDIYLERAERIVENILGRATESEAGLFWRLPRYGFQGEGDAVFTGYFYGVAGQGLILLQQHYTQRGDHPTIRLPDDPFPRRERR